MIRDIWQGLLDGIDLVARHPVMWLAWTIAWIILALTFIAIT